MSKSVDKSLLIIEPFYGGSHKQLIDCLVKGLNDLLGICLITLPAKKWHWRARTSALYLSDHIPKHSGYKVLLTSSVLNLAEIIALRSDLAQLKKIVYFHENQLVYPVKNKKDRDFQYGYNQILSCLVADVILFNSEFNKTSFLNNIEKFFKLQPDFRPSNLKERIEIKCSVLYMPIAFPHHIPNPQKNEILHIVWPHRWEHDKNPEMFFRVLIALKNTGSIFHVSVLGESFQEHPPIFDEMFERLETNILDWGYKPLKEDYFNILKVAHVAVSTANHEFYGVSMLEAVSCGCFALCPNKLVYPEIYPKSCLYEDEKELLSKLRELCKNPYLTYTWRENMDIDLCHFSVEELLPEYEAILTH